MGGLHYFRLFYVWSKGLVGVVLPWPTGVIILRNVNVPNVPIFFHHALNFFDSKHYSDGLQVFGIQYFVIFMECLLTFRTAQYVM